MFAPPEAAVTVAPSATFVAYAKGLAARAAPKTTKGKDKRSFMRAPVIGEDFQSSGLARGICCDANEKGELGLCRKLSAKEKRLQVSTFTITDGLENLQLLIKC
jgi:hypothetical protein